MGFVFDNRHTDEFGIIAKTLNRPFMPNPKIFVEDLPEIDGVIDYSEYNSSGTTKYHDTAHEIQITVLADNIEQLRIKLDTIRKWLMVSGYKPLIYDDSKMFKYFARIETISNVEYLAGGKAAKSVLYFRVKPYHEVI